jgi:hypothetical protein
MKTMTDKTTDRSGIHTSLDSIRMSESGRRHAETGLRNGERIAGLVLRAAADMHALARYAEHAAASLAGGIRTMFAKPVKH